MRNLALKTSLESKLVFCEILISGEKNFEYDMDQERLAVYPTLQIYYIKEIQFM